MSLPDTNSVAPVYIEEKPDFSKKVLITSDYKTTVATSQAGGEQRARWRFRPRYSMEYTIASMTIAEFSVRRSSYVTELQSPVVIPIWTHRYPLVSMGDANTVEIGISLDNKKFKVGGYVYFYPQLEIEGENNSDVLVESPAPCFRVIAAVNSTSLTLNAGSNLAGNPSPIYLAGTFIYPCIYGQHKTAANGFDAKRIHETDQVISIEEL